MSRLTSEREKEIRNYFKYHEFHNIVWELFDEIIGLRADKAERNDKSADLLIQAVWDVRASRERIAKLREACEKVDKKQWFEPSEETGICGWCDLHCSQPYLGHNSDCPILIIHNALQADSESEGK